MSAKQRELAAAYAAMHEGDLFNLLDSVLETYETWEVVRQLVQEQIEAGFVGEGPGEESTCKILRHLLVVMDAVHPLILKMTSEAEDLVDLYYTWLYD